MEQTEGRPHYHPEQEEMPFAVVLGEPLATPPTDLYIPPDALEVFLDAFEGPLDLLLYLIRRQNLNILDIPIAEITDQYVQYIEMMNELRLELAAEYLVMAAMLAEIKSRMLLPKPVTEEEEGDDPRAELIRRLQEYERYKQAAEDLDGLQHMTRDTFQVHAELVDRHVEAREPDVVLREVLLALQDVLHRADMFTSHRVEKEALSVREKMSYVLQRVNAGEFIRFTDLFVISEGRLGLVVTFLAILELLKEALLELVQAEDFAPIHVKAKLS
ncbi:MAG: segregation/condensation protein A [Candidatus Thiodiazotropha sp. (ex Epidulcina cf. delphinae)]|nr:segregation/condensation protein A [Candidatus Thiodiazotropha sp. (ex Epidulcina cf. delphinae)]